MKHLIFFLVIAFCFCHPLHSFAQQAEDSLIRRLENAEKTAILKGDTLALTRLMSKHIVVQNPENTIVGFQQIMDRIKSGKINYGSFDREIERITIVNQIAVVMGLETLVPKGDTKHAGKTVQRRFTNIWTKEAGTWKLTDRQATIISIQE